MESVEYGTTSLVFELLYTERKTLSIEVHPTMDVKVLAPNETEMGLIKAKVLKRGAWIVKQQQYFESFLPRTPHREYVSGETHLYLGKRYILKVKKSGENVVKLKGGFIYVYTLNNESKSVKKLLIEWYMKHSIRIFEKHFKKCLNSFLRYKIGEPDLGIQRMKNRWGSCTAAGKIILNPELIKAPTKCIDYVIYHELCHLIEPNHTKQFYALQDSIFPENKYWKSRLEEVMK